MNPLNFSQTPSETSKTSHLAQQRKPFLSTARMMAFVLVASVPWMACGQSEDTKPSSQKSQPNKTTAPKATPTPAVDESASQTHPTESDTETTTANVEKSNIAASEKRGASLYAIYCASCHGIEGHGDGPAAAALNPTPARHTDTAYMDSLSDDHLFLVVQKGGTAVGKSAMMTASEGLLTDEQIWDVVAFMRKLAAPDATASSPDPQ